jgi:hypothetical protein
MRFVFKFVVTFLLASGGAVVAAPVGTLKLTRAGKPIARIHNLHSAVHTGQRDIPSSGKLAATHITEKTNGLQYKRNVPSPGLLAATHITENTDELTK